MRRFLLWLLVAAPAASAQPALPFTVEVVERVQTRSPALHSTAVAHHGGRWLFVTGRTDGIHPFTAGDPAFPYAFSNGAAVVYEPATDTRWEAPLSSLPETVERALRVTNPQFVQVGERLYVAGGYGVTPEGTFRTFRTLTAVHVPGLIEAVVTGAPLAPHLRQTEAPWLAVTGGFLVREGDGAAPGSHRLALVGGHRYDGRYLGPDEDQEYTDSIRRFTLTDDGTTLALSEMAEQRNAAIFHRRDGNLAPFVLPNGDEGYALYGGVFTPSAPPLPYRTPVIVMPTGTVELPFLTRFGHYTAPLVPVVDAEGAMHTVFFGGMNQFKVNNTTGAVQQDQAVPFVDDVTALSIGPDGSVYETILPFFLPGRLGTNAHLIAADGLPTTGNGVLRLDGLSGRTHVGVMHGGIEVDFEHPAMMGLHATGSRATGRLFDVFVTPLTVSTEPGAGVPAFALSAPQPNPTAGRTTLSLSLAAPAHVAAEAFDALGRRVAVLADGRLGAGGHALAFEAPAPGAYVVRVIVDGQAATRRVIAR